MVHLVQARTFIVTSKKTSDLTVEEAQAANQAIEQATSVFVSFLEDNAPDLEVDTRM